MRPARVAAACAVLLLGAGPRGGAGQDVRVAVTPDTVTVGDIFHVAVRLDLPPGVRVESPDSLAVSGEIENAGRHRVASEPLEGGGQRLTLAYPLTAWRPGPVSLPPLPLRLIGPGEEARTLDLRLPRAVVRSVLPPDTAGIQPQPLKDVLGGERILWPILLALALLAAAAAGLIIWLRRRRRADAPVLAPALPPRERALAALDRARGLGLVEAGEIKAFYTLITDALREFLEATEPGWSRDLTTSEVLATLRGELDARAWEALARVFEAADMVKFARRRPDAPVAFEEWQAARDWVASFERPLATASAASGTPQPSPEAA
ncbi:MAG TPA: hypothetical protein VF192_09810 [Longimicrobiales bacterium]